MSKITVSDVLGEHETFALEDDATITFRLGDKHYQEVKVWLRGNSLFIGEGYGLIVIPHVSNRIEIKINENQ